MPDEVGIYFSKDKAEITHGTAINGRRDPSRATQVQWAPVQEREDIDGFVNQAIEWEIVGGASGGIPAGTTSAFARHGARKNSLHVTAEGEESRGPINLEGRTQSTASSYAGGQRTGRYTSWLHYL